MPAIIMGAMGGVGEALQNVGGTMFKASVDSDARNQESALATERAKTLELFKSGLATSEREDQSRRITAEAGRVVDQKVGAKRGIIEAGIADRTSWTPEQQAVVDASLGKDRDAMMDDPKTRNEAAMRTGDISPKDAATLTQKDDAAIWKQLWEQSKLESQDRRFLEGQDRADARQEKNINAAAERQDKQLAALFARLEKKGEKGDDAGSKLQSTQVDGNGYVVGIYRDGSTKRLTDPDGNPVTSQTFESRVDRTANALVKDGDSKYRKMAPEELRAQVRRTLMNQDAPPKPATPSTSPSASPAAAPKPAASAVPSLPAGAKQIGTSGGKPVYETPDGKRFIGR